MNFSSGDCKLDGALMNWLKWDKNPKTRAAVRDAIQKGEWDYLSSVMLSRVKFGTAGLRGKMAPGIKCMNDVVVLQAAQGLVAYFKKVCSKEQLENGIVIGYDGRHNSRRFAELSANVFARASIKVHLFSDVCPTPFVSFATIKYGCIGGIMVTASHNPKEDNGYKVYWGNGSQIITPHDDNILACIEENLNIADEHWNIENIVSNPLVTDPLDEVMKSYCDYIKESCSKEVLEQNKKSRIPIVYSAMHGVGYNAIVNAFEAASLQKPVPVKKQQWPNPEFPTVKFPNPEEKECLELSKQLAEEKSINLVLANDPDADRLAVAEFQPNTDTWKVFSGNEIGVLLGWWLLKQYKDRGHDSDQLYFLSSFVSSRMLKTIAEKEGCRFVQTLTGFKWMGNKTILLERRGVIPLFAYEEAIGFMCSSRVPDKDGVSAAVQVTSLASYLFEHNLSLSDKLEQLYNTYGYHVTHNSYFLCTKPDVTTKIFHNIRNHGGDGKYPTSAGGFAIANIDDLSSPKQPVIPTEGEATFDSKARTKGGEDNEGTGLDLPYTSGEMMIFELEGGINVKLRTSGTEPKIKYYAEIAVNAPTAKEKVAVQQEFIEKVKLIVDDLVKPSEHGLPA